MAWSRLFWWGVVPAFAVACSREFPNGGHSSGGAQSIQGGATALGGADAGMSAEAGSDNPIDVAGGGAEAGSSPGGAAGMSGSAGTTVGGDSVGGAGETEVACPKGVQGHCSAGEAYPSYAGYTLELVEDFPAALDLDADPIFTWSDGGIYSSQTGFRRENIEFEAGEMVLVAESKCPPTTDNNGCYPARKSYAEALAPNAQADIPAMSVWSGELRSRYNNYRYGRYEVRMQSPSGNPNFPQDVYKSGNSITAMYVSRQPHNVQWVEIDANLEAWNRGVVGLDAINATGAVEYPVMNAAPVQKPVEGNIGDMHVYAFEWTPTSVAWFVDGNLVRTFTGTADDPIPTLSAKIVMDLWVHSDKSYAGDAAYNVYPMAAHFDYFRFYRLDTDTKYPCDAVPGCLDPADKTKSAQNNPNEVSYGQ